ncbi:MAG: NADH-quinone oxidoreductase subunit J family protein [Tepidisphaeraceae bacterium]
MHVPAGPRIPLLAQADAAPLDAARTLAATPMAPAVILGLCVFAGLATWLMLPSRREIAISRIAGVILLAAGVVLAALLIHWTEPLGGMSLYFWIFSAVALIASVRVVTHTKPVYSARYFVLTVFATGGLFVLLWAEFIAAALVLIYAGAILITYVFVIMLASEASASADQSDARIGDVDGVSREPFLAAAVGFAIMGLLLFVIFDKSQALDHRDLSRSVASTDAAAVAQVMPEPSLGLSLGSSQALGQELLENQAINVQLAAVILTIAMVGAITLARRRIIAPASAHPADTVVSPGTPVDDNPHSIAVYGTDNPRHKAYPEN